MKVRISNDANGYWSSRVKGQIVEVSPTADGEFRDIRRRCRYNSKFCTIIEEENMFEPKSGMIFKTNENQWGLFVGVGEYLMTLFMDSKSSKFTTYNPKVLPKDALSLNKNITHIYSGLWTESLSALSTYLGRGKCTGDLLWERFPAPKPIRLNSEYEAEIVDKNTVKVGCQTIPASAIYELAKALDEIK